VVGVCFCLLHSVKGRLWTRIHSLLRRSPPPRLWVEPLEAREVLSTFYVAPTGNDGAAGSSLAPWQTLQKAANTAGPGDTVLVRAGTYTGFNLSTSGTASQPITFRADPGVTITQPNNRTPDGINLEGASYITIDGFNVTG